MSLMKATKIFSFVSILIFAGSVKSQISDSIYTIPKGTKILVRMDNEINSKVSSVNDTFTATLSAPVINRGVEVLPSGTVVEGRITSVKKAASGKKPGKFEVIIETLFLPNGGKRKIEASLIKGEKAKASRSSDILTIAGAAGIGSLLESFIEKSKGALIGAGIGLGIGTSIVFLQKGEEARIKAGEEFSIFLKRNLTLPPQDY